MRFSHDEDARIVLGSRSHALFDRSTKQCRQLCAGDVSCKIFYVAFSYAPATTTWTMECYTNQNTAEIELLTDDTMLGLHYACGWNYPQTTGYTTTPPHQPTGYEPREGVSSNRGCGAWNVNHEFSTGRRALLEKNRTHARNTARRLEFLEGGSLQGRAV